MTEKREAADHRALEHAVAAARVQRPVGSPCIGVCRLDARRRYCEGCLRNVEEIASWRAASDSEKLRVLDALESRLAQNEAAR